MRTYDLFHSARRRAQWSPENRKVPALVAPPDKQTIRYVVNRAATARRRRYQNDDRYRRFTEAALFEQVCGVEGAPRDQRDVWWLVGRVVDVIAGVELELLCRPGETIRVREIVEPVVEKAPPTLLPEKRVQAPRFADERGGNRLTWGEW
jgi:hypothetical protein